MNKIAITGLGLVSPSGIDKRVFWANIKAGHSTVDHIKRFDATKYRSRIAGQVRELEAKLAKHERTDILIEATYLRKLEQATLVPWHESAAFNRWAGFGLGLIAAGLTAWAAIEVYEEINPRSNQ